MGAKIITRAELAIRDEAFDGVLTYFCGLCGGYGDELIEHEPDCVLADPAVVAVDVTPRTTPREDICGRCPADGKSHCVVPDRKQESHERLRELCSRYAKEDN